MAFGDLNLFTGLVYWPHDRVWAKRSYVKGNYADTREKTPALCYYLIVPRLAADRRGKPPADPANHDIQSSGSSSLPKELDQPQFAIDTIPPLLTHPQPWRDVS